MHTTCSQELESAIGGFTVESKKDPKEKTFKNLTYEDVYWASKIENPLVHQTHTIVAQPNTCIFPRLPLVVSNFSEYGPAPNCVLCGLLWSLMLSAVY